MRKQILLWMMCGLAALPLYAKVTLASKGETRYTIIYDFSANDPILGPAVRDLSRFLEEITGAAFPIATEADGPKLYVGRRAPGDTKDFASRERRIKSVGEDVYFYGDVSYGAAGAIYNFLREFCGCRWFTAVGDMKIPKNPELSFEALDYSHVPSFKSMEHGSKWIQAARNPDIRDWLRRNNSFLMPTYAFGDVDDAWNYIGPVTHTLFAYIPPIKRPPRTFNSDGAFCAGPHFSLKDKEYFSTHPEYFSLWSDGKRVPNKQVCFNNENVCQLLLENIQKAIEFEHYDPQTYAVLDFSQNDYSGGFCFCDKCKADTKKYATPGASYFRFLVRMGTELGKKYPKLTFRFFGYQESMTGIPPKGIRFPDNVSVILAPIQQDWSKDFTAYHNTRFLKQMREWGKLCKEVWLWNYPILYPHGMMLYALLPGIYRNTANMKIAYDFGTRYIIAEQGGSVVHGYSFKDLNVYLQNLQGERITTDVDAAIKEFCDFCYGAASDDMIAYLQDTDKEAKADPGHFHYNNDPRVLKSLHSGKNIARWQKLFDKMEAEIKGDARAEFNVHRARINLDQITLLVYPDLAKADPAYAQANPIGKVYERHNAYITADAQKQYAHYPAEVREAHQRSHVRSFTEQAVKMCYLFNSVSPSYPAELLTKYGMRNLISVMPGKARIAPEYYGDETPFGFAIKCPYTTQDIGAGMIGVELKDGMPYNMYRYHSFHSTLFDPKNRETFMAAIGFKCYFVGREKLSPASEVRLATASSGGARCYTGCYFDPENPDQEYDFYISLKDAGDGKNLLVDRLVLAKVTE